jgi:hypothetical protein
MMRLAGVLGAAVGVALFATDTMALQNGAFLLKPQETKQIVVETTARELRICNDISSGGAIGVILGLHNPLMLQPGSCADDMGDRILATNQGDSAATGTWRTSYIPNGDHVGVKFKTH